MSGVYAGRQPFCSAPGAKLLSHISHVLCHCNHLVNGFWNAVLAWSNNFYGISPPHKLFSAHQMALLKHFQHGSTGLVSVLHYRYAHHILRQGFYSEPHAIVMMVGVWSDYCMSSLQNWYEHCLYSRMQAQAEISLTMPLGLRRSTPDMSPTGTCSYNSTGLKRVGIAFWHRPPDFERGRCGPV
jgi:hypothetical protein